MSSATVPRKQAGTPALSLGSNPLPGRDRQPYALFYPLPPHSCSFSLPHTCAKSRLEATSRWAEVSAANASSSTAWAACGPQASNASRRRSASKAWRSVARGCGPDPGRTMESRAEEVKPSAVSPGASSCKGRVVFGGEGIKGR